MEKHLQPKSKHHHVWADYLRRWSLNNKDVHFTTAKRNIVCDSVKGIAMEKHFYQITPLDRAHIAVIKGFSVKSPKELQELHMSYLKDFLLRQSLEGKYRKSSVQIEEAEKLLFAMKCNMLENLHSSHENETQPIITALANRDLTILNDANNMSLFMQFFGHQISRTKMFRDITIVTMSGFKSMTEKNMAVVIEECWWFLSYMFGMNIGADLFATRKEDKHCLLINNTEIPFITSDQPIINVHESLQDNIVAAPDSKQCDFYYPISPKVAYMVNKSERFERGLVEVSLEAVNELNIKIAKKANVHIVSNDTASLKPLIKYVGAWLQTVQSYKL